MHSIVVTWSGYFLRDKICLSSINWLMHGSFLLSHSLIWSNRSESSESAIRALPIAKMPCADFLNHNEANFYSKVIFLHKQRFSIMFSANCLSERKQMRIAECHREIKIGSRT
jgi:hypothetical protein